jgi:site-specific DNA-cytosine methylase
MRTITSHEAARIQSFPDWFWMIDSTKEMGRADFHKIIGDAVPANMVFPLVAALFA